MPAYKDTTYQSHFFLKRWLHNKRFSDALILLDLQPSDLFLDYGCGDAHLLAVCLHALPSANLFGFEPALNMYEQAMHTVGNSAVTLVTRIDELQTSFKKIACLEVCEHLAHQDLIITLSTIRKLLAPEGRVVFSVPIEIGAPALMKNLFRFFKNRKFHNLTIGTHMKAFLGLSLPRNTLQTLSDIPYIYSHVGFNYNTFEVLLKQHFTIERKYFSPVNIFGPALNNTIYYCCRHK